ncbi:MAG: SufD family Fe-S cluster assembly protein [Robiginitomaculum sp.]|nr:SufD family Fe-S cluster assembly protein [Robiginitomaculum sp.]
MTNMPRNPLIENLPHRRMEAWKWTDVRGVAAADTLGLSSTCNPTITSPNGITVSSEGVSPSETVMGKLATTFAHNATVITVPAGFKSDVSVILSDMTSGHARLIFKVGKGAALSVVETHESGAASFVNIDMRFELAQGAKLTRTIFHNDHADTTRIVTANINAWADAEITQHTLSFGGGLTRFETRIASLGENLKAEIHGAYLLNDKRHCDMTSYIDLGAESAHIRQSVKGVVSDKARGVFQGKFHVRRPAQFTDAEMRHDAVMLSDTCQIRAKPELEIYADDVACAHGNTIGALDESALFYMRQRGLPLSHAKALLIQAFVAEAFDGMADNSDCMARITDWLEQNS